MSNKKEVVEVVESDEQIVDRLVHLISDKSKAAIAARNRYVIGLSGGSDVDFVCQALLRISTNWSKWKFIFCDERVVSHNDPECTFNAYRMQLFHKMPLTDQQFVIINPHLTSRKAAFDYENKLKALYPGEALPVIDLLMMGVGPDGHTCSLFPGHPILQVTDRWVAPIEDSPKPPPCRVTLTYPVINNALNGIFVISGRDKGEIVQRLLKDKEDLPANRVKPNELLWLLDQTAAYQL